MHGPLTHGHGLHHPPGARLPPLDLCPALRLDARLAPQVFSHPADPKCNGTQKGVQHHCRCSPKCRAVPSRMDLLPAEHHNMSLNCMLVWLLPFSSFARVALRSAPHNEPDTMGCRQDTTLVPACHVYTPGDTGHYFLPSTPLGAIHGTLVPRRIRLLAHATPRTVYRHLRRLVL